jgi:NAD-dependent dihydropyrimidine dehydrogenase PreA subunit
MQTDTTVKDAGPIVIKALIAVGLVIGLSIYSVKIWGEKPEVIEVSSEIVLSMDMTVAAFGEANGLQRKELKGLFGLTAPSDLHKAVGDFGLSGDALRKKAKKIRVLETEHAAKNWFKIPLKFGVWFAFLLSVFFLLRRNAINAKNRKWIYLGSASLFGVILGADPSPTGTVKDAIALFGAEGVIFPPRMVALSIFLLTVLLANKFICSWGCQFGVLQDFLFRLNRNSKDRKGILGQVKLPLALTNALRILFFVVFTAVALVFAYDLVGLIDPFKIYKPLFMGWIGAGFLTVLLLASLFVYRPWCHLFCPFGLVGWLVEKVSINKISVDYANCKDACVACTRACPSDSMEAILKQHRTIPDCFSCNSCVEACPSNAVSFKFGKREKPPEGKFR